MNGQMKRYTGNVWKGPGCFCPCGAAMVRPSSRLTNPEAALALTVQEFSELSLQADSLHSLITWSSR